MRPARPFFLLSALALVACQQAGPLATAAQPSPSAAAVVAAAQTSVPSTASPAPSSMASAAPGAPPAAPDLGPTAALPGKVTAFGTPFGGAVVTATVLGEKDVLAHTTAAADGSFTLAVPLSAGGKLLEVAATRGTDGTLAAMVTAPGAPKLQDAAPFEVSPATSVALAIALPRLVAAMQMVELLTPKSAKDAQALVERANQDFVDLVRKAGVTIDAARPGLDLQAKLLHALPTDGSATLTTEAASTLDGLSPQIRGAFIETMSDLGDGIAAACKNAGVTLPPAILAPVAFDGTVAGPVNSNGGGASGGGGSSGGGSSGGGSSGGGSSGGGTTVDPVATGDVTASGTLSIGDGVVVDGAATASMRLGN